MNWIIDFSQTPLCPFYDPLNNGISLRLWALLQIQEYNRHNSAVLCCVTQRKFYNKRGGRPEVKLMSTDLWLYTVHLHRTTKEAYSGRHRYESVNGRASLNDTALSSLCLERLFFWFYFPSFLLSSLSIFSHKPFLSIARLLSISLNWPCNPLFEI